MDSYNSINKKDKSNNNSSKQSDEDKICTTVKQYLVEERTKTKKDNSYANQRKIAKWRTKRTKTTGVALVYCLNIGIDPPDIIKTDPSARLECWLDPLSLPQQKALDMIGKALQTQYETLQSSVAAQFTTNLDPTVDEVKKSCLNLRHHSKLDRVLFHYNGHGVPKPTQNGEIWVFNKNYTQYIPLSIYELQSWVGSPSLYVFDCSGAGLIMNWFLQYVDQREKDFERMSYGSNPSTVVPLSDYILLGACQPNEILPMNPNLPADMFTACLTTPVKMALLWFCLNSPLCKKGITIDLINKIPGRINDRRSPLGELNWIFFAITDTIAWSVLPRDLFHRLFRQDLLVASLFRNFLLAERIMRSHGCTPMSFPKLPPQTYQHPLWQAWDLAVDMCLSQLPDIIENPNLEYHYSPFFADQLTAFEVWLDFPSEQKKPPEQLPILLQVLLSQLHRKKALHLLGRFLDLGYWAVNQALSVGIFRCVLKLLTPSPEFRQILVFIWTKLMACDKTCQVDLVKENGHGYFITVLATPSVESDQRAMCAFILSVVNNNCKMGQLASLNNKVISICLAQLSDPDATLRQWILLCLAKLWENYDEAKTFAVKENAHEKICALLVDPVPEVRASVLYAIGTFLIGSTEESRRDIELNLGLTIILLCEDGSPKVRRELIISLSRLIHLYEKQFREAVLKIQEENSLENSRRKLKSSTSQPLFSSSNSLSSIDEPTTPNVYAHIWKVMVAMTTDPYPDLAKLADISVHFITDQLPSFQSSIAISQSPSKSNIKALKSPAKNGTKAQSLSPNGPSAFPISLKKVYTVSSRFVLTRPDYSSLIVLISSLHFFFSGLVSLGFAFPIITSFSSSQSLQ